MKLTHIAASVAMAVAASSASAFTVGYYDSSVESYGLAGSYISQAKQSLINKGYTLTSTNTMNAGFLSGVDAVYVGLLNATPSAGEIAALQNFVNVQGGFLFIQTDWASAPWTAPANAILSNWGIAHGSNLGNDSGHVTVGSSEWVSNPNVVTNFIGSAHSIITSAPANFEVLGRDDAGNTILGVFDAGAGRSSDVLIATDINFWDDSFGWSNAGNRNLWDNIWQAAATQTGGGNVPEPSMLALLGISALGAAFARRRKST